MPSRNTTDISHEQVTDHDIEARPVTASLLRDLKASSSVELVPVGNFPAGDREYGLAYAQVSLLGASRGDAQAMAKALRLLTKASAAGANDTELLVRLGYLQQLSGATEKARASYTAALNADPFEPLALADLAVLDASSGRTPEALHLLQRLMEDDPTQTAAGLNLAFIECKLGRVGEARTLLTRLAAYNPDDPQLRDYLRTGNYAGQSCPVATQR
jgi:Flp pilus assembly protein TadD